MLAETTRRTVSLPSLYGRYCVTPPQSLADTGPTLDGQTPEVHNPARTPRPGLLHLRPEVLPPQSMQRFGYAAMCRCVLLVRSLTNS
ncbi:hypothetical protein ACLKA7_004908 [Drosophila subpalustris]